jgi:hypothetical protein
VQRNTALRDIFPTRLEIFPDRFGVFPIAMN